jgi:hypothetical protein
VANWRMSVAISATKIAAKTLSGCSRRIPRTKHRSAARKNARNGTSVINV